jgi:uncharacterized protein (TIGR03066 family)
MSALKWLSMTTVMVLLSANARAAEDVDYAKMVVGKWEVTKTEDGSVPPGCTIEFASDGKVKANIKKDGEEKMLDGTYTVEKNTLVVTMKEGGEDKKQTITITKISEKEMSTKGEDGKVVELKKK